MESDGAPTPRTGTPKLQKARLRAMDVLEDMSDAAQNLNVATCQLQVQTEAFNDVSITNSQDPLLEITKLRQLLRRHEETHTKKMELIRASFQVEIETGSKLILEEVRSEIKATVEEIIKDEVEQQIGDHIPVPLKQQAEETKEQLRVVQASLQNSRSRSANSGLQAEHLYEPLAIVLTPEGKRSRWWPADLGSLFAYDLKSARALVKDFGLVDSEKLHINFQRFLVHIGTNIELFIPNLESKD
ncbi:hypothetical protein BKA70DRAFT_1421119 [Coprinopsis sp. MPI-PUGE-AT-0042]|nr:hypothetical protein BKA70DRAFT_1421119 [Coprinopsis sp. MPI-PUGE-AT-0042]